MASLTPALDESSPFPTTYVDALWKWVQGVERANVTHRALLRKYGLDCEMTDEEKKVHTQKMLSDAQYPHQHMVTRPLPPPYTSEYGWTRFGQEAAAKGCLVPADVRVAIDELEIRLRKAWNTTPNIVTS